MGAVRRTTAAAVLLATVSGAALVVGSAVAAPTDAPGVPTTSVLAPTSAVWFWRDQVAANGVAIPPADPTASADDLVVAGPDDGSGAPAKTAYLHFDLPALPAGGHLTSCALTLAVDGAAHQLFPPGMPPTLVAVRAASGFAGFGGPRIGADKPTDVSVTVEPAVTGTFDAATQAMTFQIPGICKKWLEENNIGVGVRTAPGAVTPEQVGFVTKTAQLAVTVEVPAEPTPAATETSAAPAPAASSSAPTTTAVALTPAPTPAPPAPLQPVPVPATAAPVPVILPSEILPPQPAPQVVVPPTTSPPDAATSIPGQSLDLRGVHSGIPLGFWLSGLGVLVLAALAGFALRRGASAPVTRRHRPGTRAITPTVVRGAAPRRRSVLSALQSPSRPVLR
jgi:hypothetical protein